ncbi:probable 3=hydroxybutyryl-CoA dehydrogenase FadB3 (beta-hydroxybutyrl-CoA dehydrogenase) (BHBD) [Marinomonas sp. MED121]|uniref:3-hydroxyacyl-CoA dehydrogenase family protein n=1 Tax=Marinomonas sp. MED121 TaxID=314277 RepID=UPI000068FAAF|nr:3-hydroxyacyl-CoA dehydrogenase NAD-binding domain-containing protein [Marinomonas sp. MED121]EAQ63928.1 probable 3=hydroxybutyryl-CoA dehydrogenase FadB3 (beta-hydroxybutyrl-CoA dehydrogenase) (BHBD) [Marinomonas sp. MED121]
MQNINTIAVIGAGLMGAGIAQVFASQGKEVRVYDPIDASLMSLAKRIGQNLALLGQSQDCLENLVISSSLADTVRDADIVFEAAPEQLEIKRSIFRELLPLVKDSAILASNTSVIPIKDIGQDLDHKGRLVGTHWWNPAYLIPLVEVVQSTTTSDWVVAQTIALLEQVGKKPVHVKKDVAGFVGNRLQHALWREAIALINDGVCDAETVDIVVKNSFGMRLPVLGPIENSDLVGLDLTLDIHNVILKGINRDETPSALLQEKVALGELGMKSGKGFRHWTDLEADQVRNNLVDYLVRVNHKTNT